jgi:hypothetical protein
VAVQQSAHFYFLIREDTVKSISAAIGLLLAVLCTASLAQQGVARQIEATAVVVSVDRANRSVTLRTEKGEQLTTQLSETVKNFDQIQPGDKVVLTYTEALAVRIRDGDATSGKKAAHATAKEGEKPAGAVGQVTTASVKIDAIDTKKNAVTFTGPDGTSRTVAVKDPQYVKVLKRLKPGDVVYVAYAEAVAVSVRAAGK